MRIVFMGTPGFAVPSLEILLNAGYEVVAVITAPDRKGGRGRKQVIQSEVKKYAVSRNLNVLQPSNLKSPKFNKILEDLKIDLQVVVAFRMLPEIVWNRPPLGTINVHGSLLPSYRGAAPINWAVINGESQTGVTTFKLKHQIDTGNVILQRKIAIYPWDTAGNLHDRMMYVGADLLLDTVRLIENGNARYHSQDEKLISHAPKLGPHNTVVHLDKKGMDIYNLVRGLAPFPTAYIEIGNKRVKILRTRLTDIPSTHPGKLISDNRNYISMHSADRVLNIEVVQWPGKKAMEVKQFLNGFDLNGVDDDMIIIV